MLDAYGSDPKRLNDMKLVYRFLKELPDLIEMKRLGLPIVYDADASATGKDPGGITGVVIIAESHISIHTFAKKGFLTLDLYSCSNFESMVKATVKFTKKTFSFKQYELQVIKRGLKYPAVTPQ